MDAAVVNLDTWHLRGKWTSFSRAFQWIPLLEACYWSRNLKGFDSNSKLKRSTGRPSNRSSPTQIRFGLQTILKQAVPIRWMHILSLQMLWRSRQIFLPKRMPSHDRGIHLVDDAAAFETCGCHCFHCWGTSEAAELASRLQAVANGSEQIQEYVAPKPIWCQPIIWLQHNSCRSTDASSFHNPCQQLPGFTNCQRVVKSGSGQSSKSSKRDLQHINIWHTSNLQQSWGAEVSKRERDYRKEWCVVDFCTRHVCASVERHCSECTNSTNQVGISISHYFSLEIYSSQHFSLGISTSEYFSLEISSEEETNPKLTLFS